jgi:hypothetical protein
VAEIPKSWTDGSKSRPGMFIATFFQRRGIENIVPKPARKAACRDKYKIFRAAGPDFVPAGGNCE